MKKRYYFRFTAYLALLITGISFPSMVLAAEDVVITHAVKSYVTDGLTATVNLNIQVQNTSGSIMNNITVRPTPMPKNLLFMDIADVESLSIESIAVEANVSTDYIITSYITLPQEVIAATPIFWEVRYIDGSGQEKGVIAISSILIARSGL